MSFYPVNPDTSVESFLLINSEYQINNLEQTYNLSQLVPLNYRKIMDPAIIEEPIAYVPLRELIYLTSPAYTADEITNEYSNFFQSSSLLIAFQQASNYYNVLMKDFQIGAGVVTEIKTDLVTQALEGTTKFGVCIQHKLKIEWFVVPGSTFS